jgi:hypothetical protein
MFTTACFSAQLNTPRRADGVDACRGGVQCSGLSLMPGLRQEEGFTTPFGASLFAAATALWRADPWTAIPAARRRPIKVRAPLDAVISLHVRSLLR